MVNRFMTRCWICILIMFSVPLSAQQICSGNLGENIFSIGDFGSGEDNIIQVNPQIAPGYNYTTNPPPSDGFYIITNDMRNSNWNSLYPTWIKIPDNSDDPQGYMMVVNASFEPGVFYEETVTGLCENTLYEFSSDVINLIRIGVSGHHEPNLSFLLDDVTQYSSGIIPQDETWHKHGFTFVTGPDQTSVKLSLINNAPGGIGNDLALDNISFRPCGPSAFANASDSLVICSNDLTPIEVVADTEAGSAVQWQFFSEEDQEWDNIPSATDFFVLHDIFDPGQYFYRYLSAGSSSNLENEKCRVISDVATVTVLPIEFTVYDTICENVTYEFGSQQLTEAGFYEETLVASSGCDSFVDLFLTVLPDPGISMDLNSLDPICFGDPTGYIEFLVVNGATEPLTYFINDEPSSTLIPTLSSGSYILRVEDRYNCFAEEEIILVDPEEFTVDLGPDTTVNFGDILNFSIESSEPIGFGNWIGEQLSCLQCIQNSVQPFEDGSYVFEAQNGEGCSASDTIFIRIREVENLFFQPNVFSPNEDGINDRFSIQSGSQAIQRLKKFAVFDRFGNILFSTINRDFYNEDHSWDGIFNGSPVEEGVYTYFYELELIDGSIIYIGGDVTVTR